jgi:hypothetical protein
VLFYRELGAYYDRAAPGLGAYLRDAIIANADRAAGS